MRGLPASGPSRRTQRRSPPPRGSDEPLGLRSMAGQGSLLGITKIAVICNQSFSLQNRIDTPAGTAPGCGEVITSTCPSGRGQCSLRGYGGISPHHHFNGFLPCKNKMLIHGSASIRSIAPRARAALSPGTVTRGVSAASESRTFPRSVFFMFRQIAVFTRG